MLRRAQVALSRRRFSLRLTTVLQTSYEVSRYRLYRGCDVSCAAQNVVGHTRQASHFDTEAAVSGAGFDSVGEREPTMLLRDRRPQQVICGIARPARPARGNASTEWRAAAPGLTPGARSPPRRWPCRRGCWCRARSRRARPGCDPSRRRSTAAVSSISTMNVERPPARSSTAPIRVKMRIHQADARLAPARTTRPGPAARSAPPAASRCSCRPCSGQSG